MSNIKKIASVILCLELLVLAGSIMNGSFEPATVLVGTLSDLTNHEREQNNLAPLKIDSLLSKAAQLKSEDMARNQYFSHVSPDGKTPWYWLDLAGYKYDYAGENLAINFSESKDVTDAWMNSPVHRENLLKESYTEMGSGVSTGTYEGRAAVFIVQDYASPRVGDSSAPAINDSVPTKVVSNTFATNTQVLGAMTKFVGNMTLQKIVIYLISILLLIVIIILLIKFLIKYCKKHPTFLNILLILLAIILGTYLLYELVFKEKTFIATSANYSAENTPTSAPVNQ